MKFNTIAVIVAGGYGARFDSNIPKQYHYSILRKTIEKFIFCPLIDQIQVVIRAEDIALYEKETQDLDLLPVAFGGKTRADSVKNGLISLDAYQPNLVLVHDAVRPFVSYNLIEETIYTLQNNPNHGVAPTLPITETTKRISNNKSEIIDRTNLYTIQTPQAFYYKQLVKAFEECTQSLTDESSLDIPMIYIPGEKNNIKITYKEDMSMEIRTGIGFDAHRFSPEISIDNKIILGGIAINHEKKLEAHSDGDVLIHSLVDAILGATGNGDIGEHFPPSDNKWKNADSRIFLEFTKKLLKQKNASINNIDIIIICETPKITPYKKQIQLSLAKILEISADIINIKATTTEKMGFTGRKEGIAVQSLITIQLSN